MKFAAFLKDSLRETMDKKSFWVLGILSIIFVLFCFSISFEPTTPKEALNDLVDGFNRVVGGKGKDVSSQQFWELDFEADEIEEIGEDDDRIYEFRLEASPVEEFYRAVYLNRALDKGEVSRAEESMKFPTGDGGKVVEPPLDDQVLYLTEQFQRGGFFFPEIEREGPGVFRVACRPGIPQQVRGGYKMGILFGLEDFPLYGVSVNTVVLGIQLAFAEWVAGFFGVILALIFTAFFIPGMLEKGNIEILVSKPISRTMLLVYKYVGGLLYVLLLSVILIGGSWLALSIRSGYWNATYLYSVGVQTFFFAILYSVSVLFGVLWRSWIGSILMTILAWIVFTGVAGMYNLVHAPVPLFDLPQFWAGFIDVVYYILPKTSHLSALNRMELAEANLGETVLGGEEGRQQILPAAVTWPMVILTSTAFIIGVLSLSSWRFSRKDY